MQGHSRRNNNERLAVLCFLGIFLVLYSSFCYLYLLYFYLYQSPLRSSSSTPRCSRPEGKKTDQYIVSCHLWIVTNFSASNYTQKFVLSSSHHHDHFILFICTNYLRYANIILGQLADKSYNLRHADARIQSRYITNNIPQCSKPFKPGRLTTLQSVGHVATFLLTSHITSKKM